MYYSHRHPSVTPMAHYLPEFRRPSLHRSKSCTWRTKTLFFFFSTPFFFFATDQLKHHPHGGIDAAPEVRTMWAVPNSTQLVVSCAGKVALAPLPVPAPAPFPGTRLFRFPLVGASGIFAKTLQPVQRRPAGESVLHSLVPWCVFAAMSCHSSFSLDVFRFIFSFRKISSSFACAGVQGCCGSNPRQDGLP
jgi:hypothetical protein